MRQDAYSQIMGGRRTQSSSPEVPLTSNSWIADDAYSQIMGAKQFKSVLEGIQRARTRGASATAEQTPDVFDKLPFTRQALQHSTDLGLTAVEGRDGSVIPLFSAYQMTGQVTGQSAWRSNLTDAQREDGEVERMNPFNDIQLSSPNLGKPYSFYLQQGAENAHTLGQDLLSNFYKSTEGGLNRIFGIDQAPEGLSRAQAPFAYSAMDSVSGLVSGTFGLGSSVAKMIEEPAKAPEVFGETLHGIIQGVNPFEPGIKAPERFGRTVNALLLAAGALEGAGRLRNWSLERNLRANGIDKPTAREIVRSAKEGLSMFDQETGGTAPIIAPLKDIVSGTRVKSAVADIADMVKPGTSDAMLAPRSVASEAPLTTSVAQPVPTGGTLAAPKELLPNLGTQSQTGRIMPAPITEGNVVPMENITRDLFDALSLKTSRRGKTGTAQATFNPEQATIVTNSFNDLSNIGHEVGHLFNEQYELVTDFNKPRKRSPYDKELDSLWDGRDTSNLTLHQRREEGVAEFVRAYAINPDEAMARAPEFSKLFESKVPEQVKTALRSAGDSIRRHFGQEAHELVGSQIADRTGRQSVIGSTVDSLRKLVPTPRGRSNVAPFETSGTDAYRHWWTDAQAPFQAAVEYVRGITGTAKDAVLPEQDASLLAARDRYLNNKVKDATSEGLRDAQGQRVLDPVTNLPLSIEHILKPLASPEEFVDMLKYGVSERVVSKSDMLRSAAKTQADELRLEAAELLKKGDEVGSLKLDKRAERIERKAKSATQNMTNAGGGVYDSPSVHAKAIEELNANPEKAARIRESLRRYREYSNALLEYAKDRGLITQEHLDNIRAANPDYFDLGRVMDETSDRLGVERVHRKLVDEVRRKSTTGGLTKWFQKFRGSTRLIESPLVELMVNTQRTLELGERNQTMNAFVEPMRHTDNLTPFQRNLLSSVAERVKTGESGADTVTILNNGVKETWKLEPGIAKALKASGDAGDVAWLMQALSIPATVLRETVTVMPSFVGRNLLRDTWERFIKGNSGLNPIDTAKNVKLSFAKNHEWGSFYDYYGAGMSIMDDPMNRQGFARVQRKLLKQEGKVGKFFDGWREVREALEKSNRVAEYRAEYNRALEAFKSQGLDDVQAEYNAHLRAGEASRAIIDFARGGVAMKQLNRIVPFTNAAVQGLSATSRAFVTNPGKVIGKTFVTLGTLTIIEQNYNRNIGDTDEEKALHWKEYLEQPAYMRDMFFLFNVPGVGFLRIPKPFEIGVFVSIFPRLASGEWDGYFESNGNLLGGSVAKAFVPVDYESMMTGGSIPKTFVEGVTGYDFFRGRYYVPPFENNLALPLRDQSSASPLGQFLGAGKVDARKVDHFLQSTFGGVGQLAVDSSRGNKLTVAQAVNQMTGLMVDYASYSSRSVNEVLERASETGAANPFRQEFKMLKEARMNTSLSDDERTQLNTQARLALIEHARSIRQRIDEVNKQTFLEEKTRLEAIKIVIK